MNRREVLVQIGGLLLVLPASRVLLACGGTDSSPSSLSFTSSNDLGHTHTVSLQMTEVTTPPVAGVTRTTSNDLAHTHQVTLTSADLDSINQGGTVTKTTTTDDSHTHTFAFRKS